MDNSRSGSPGYKQTEVGLIPEDWQVRNLEELAYIQRGASPRPISSPVWYDPNSEVGWVRISDIPKLDAKYLKQTRDYLSDKGIARSRYLPSGSLIMSICATVGVPIITNINACIHDGFVGFTNLRQVAQDFLYYKLRELEPTFKTMGQTGSQNNLNSTLVRELSVALPPLSEQRAIAEVLSDVDALIAALERLIAKKRAIKRGAMQQLLTGKTRLPGFKEDWEVKKLEEIGTIKKGRHISKRQLSTQGKPCVLYGEIYTRYDYVADELVSFIPKEVAERATVIESGDILFAGSGETAEEIGKCFAYVGNKKAYAGGDLIVLSPTEGDSTFLGYQLNSATVREQKANLGQGVSVVHIYGSNLASIRVPFPSLPEQHAIATVLSDMDAEIAALEARRDKTRALKQGMMQQLLTGRIRLV